LVSILIKDDLPTLLLPIKAYSGNSISGHLSIAGLLITKLAFIIFTMQITKEILAGNY
jgi:hypothetical protein